MLTAEFIQLFELVCCCKVEARWFGVPPNEKFDLYRFKIIFVRCFTGFGVVVGGLKVVEIVLLNVLLLRARFIKSWIVRLEPRRFERLRS